MNIYFRLLMGGFSPNRLKCSGMVEMEMLNYLRGNGKYNLICLDDILRGGEINMDEAALVLSREATFLVEDFTVSKYLGIIKRMTDNIRKMIAGMKNAEMIIREINTYLFGVEKFGLSEQFFLNRVIDNKKGNCLGLSTLYLSISEKLKLPVYGIYLPGHVILRWDDWGYRRNIDPAMMGCEFSDDYYASKYNLPKKCLKEGVYLKNLPKKEMIAVLLNNRGSMYADKKMYEKALKDYNQSLNLKPDLVGAYHNKGDVYLSKNNFDRAIIEYNNALSINPNYIKSSMARECAYKLKDGYKSH